MADAMTSDAARTLRLVDPGRLAVLAQPTDPSSFVGRVAEQERLEAAFATAAAGYPAMVLIGGEAGIGKSRLLGQAATFARDRGALVAVGGCVPAAGGLPYGPIVALLRDLVRQTDDATASEVLERLTHDDGRNSTREASASTRTLDGLAKTRLFESLLASLATISAELPLLLGFEDLQWADSATAELIDFLMRNVSDERLLVIGTYRIEDLGREHPLRPWLAELARKPRVSQLRLAGLERVQVAALVGELVGSAPDWPMIEAIWSRSQGNPFYAEELTAARAATTLPEALRDLVLARVESLPMPTQKVIGFASVIGDRVDHDLLGALSGLDPEALDAAVLGAVEQQILLIDGVGYRFRHALLREAAYESLLPGERRRLHREIANLLDQDPTIGPADAGERVASLAAQWWAAGEWARALKPSIDAADAAAALLAYPEALEHLEHALASLQRAQDPSIDLAALTERTANIAYRAGEEERALELAKQAVTLTEVGADPDPTVRRLLLLARFAGYRGDEGLCADAFGRCRAIIAADVPSELLSRVILAEAGSLMIGFRSVEGAQRSREALAMAREVGARAVECTALNYLGCCLFELGALDEGLARLRESLLIAEELADPELLSHGYTNLSSGLLEGGRLEESAALVFDMAAIGEDMWGAKLSGAAGNSVEALIRLGRYPQARALLGEITRGVQGMCAPAPFRLPSYIEIRTGRFDEASRLLAICDEMTRGVDDVDQRGSYHRLSAELALEEGRPADAFASAQEALRIAAGTDDEVLRSEVLAFAGRAVADGVEDERQRGLTVDPTNSLAEADELAASMSALLAHHTGETAPLPRVAAYAATLSAECSRLERSDPDLWGAAVAAWEDAHEAYPHAYCLWRRAEALLEGRSRRADATACLEQAWTIGRSLQAAPLVARIERLATRARIELTEAAPLEGGTAEVATELGLTPREVEVLGQLASGRTDREIAESLFISKKTASVHVSNLLRKLSVANRVEAGKIGQAHGLTAA
jgi:DNA-binding CsgD family transcriptional regulator/tetratricopeptide (TPR) repeat protein